MCPTCARLRATAGRRTFQRNAYSFGELILIGLCKAVGFTHVHVLVTLSELKRSHVQPVCVDGSLCSCIIIGAGTPRAYALAGLSDCFCPSVSLYVCSVPATLRYVVTLCVSAAMHSKSFIKGMRMTTYYLYGFSLSAIDKTYALTLLIK